MAVDQRQVLCIVGPVGQRDKLHIGLFRGAVGFVLVAAAAGGDNIFPAVGTATGYRLDMVAGQLQRGKFPGAVHTEMAIAGKQGGIV